MGEVVSLSQYRKDRIRGAVRESSADAKIQYGLAESNKPEIGTERVRHIAEFQRKDAEAPGDDPERLS